MLYDQFFRLSYKEFMKSLEADIQHANTLAAAVPGPWDGAYIQMRLSCSPLAPVFFFLMQWLDGSCTVTPNYLGWLQVLIYKVHVNEEANVSYQRKASLREFYAVIYPLLRQLENEYVGIEDAKQKVRHMEIFNRRRLEERRKLLDKECERDDECGICMEPCTKLVLPTCNHAMCISCYHDWNQRSQSCPFCRGSLKRIKSGDLWVLTGNGDVTDTVTIAKENLRHFYIYIDSLPSAVPDTLFVFYYDYVI